MVPTLGNIDSLIHEIPFELSIALAQKVIEGYGARRNGCGGCPREVGDPRV